MSIACDFETKLSPLPALLHVGDPDRLKIVPNTFRMRSCQPTRRSGNRSSTILTKVALLMLACRLADLADTHIAFCKEFLDQINPETPIGVLLAS
jgi:hypothetical protein